MFGAVPQMIVDIGIVAGVFSALMAALALLWKTPPVRWFRTQLSESLGEWFEARVESANKQHHEYVKYHLGPNGDTKPIHKRLCDVERAVGIDDSPARLPHAVDWNGPYQDDDAA